MGPKLGHMGWNLNTVKMPIQRMYCRAARSHEKEAAADERAMACHEGMRKNKFAFLGNNTFVFFPASV